MPTFSRGPATAAPFTEMFPEDAGSSPEMILSSVLLPQPLGPTMETKFAVWISKETPSSAVTVRAPPENTLATWSATISGGTNVPERSTWLALDELVGENFLARDFPPDVEIFVGHANRLLHDIRFHVTHSDQSRFHG